MILLEQGLIQKLKKSDASHDHEKTQERFRILWKSAASAQKSEILELAGVVRASAYRVSKTGVISAKIAMAAATVLDVDPAYLTGESDEPGQCGDAEVLAFLRERGYKKLLAELPQPGVAKAKRPYTRKAPKAPQEESPSAQAEEAEPEAPLPELTEDDLVTLLLALAIRAKSGGAAAETLRQVTRLLL